jgi:amino acid transporter
MMGEKLGAKFWLWVIGISIAAGVGVMVIFAIIGAAWYAWGAIGALLFVGVVLLGFAWVYDRIHAREYDEETG